MTSPQSSTYPGSAGSDATASGSDQTEAFPNQNAGSSSDSTAESLRAASRKAVAQLKDRARQLADQRRVDVAEKIDGYSSSLHQTAQKLEQRDANLAWLAHQAADRVERAADYIRERDVMELRDDAEDFIRDHPVLVFGALFAGGVIAANLFKASERRITRPINRDDFAPERLPAADQPEQDPWPAQPRDESLD